MVINLPDKRGGRTLGSGGNSRSGAISYDNQAIKNAFFSKTSARQAQKISGDGAGHNLDEDIQKLVGTFNKVSDMSGAIASLKECSSSSEFLAHKTALMAKCQQAIAEMNLGSIESQTGYRSATFLTPYITAFTNDLNSQMSEINSLSYEELVELEKLQLEQQQIKGEIEEAYRKYNETDDPDEQAEILMLVRQLKQKHDEIALERGGSNNPPPNNRFPNPNTPNQPSGDPNGGDNLPLNLPGGKNNP
ncbi:11836_t:CDS:2 [Funneliformis geosporum]|nr:11836_t:CDS:2 [Funneliformis geosporum]